MNKTYDLSLSLSLKVFWEKGYAHLLWAETVISSRTTHIVAKADKRDNNKILTSPKLR